MNDELKIALATLFMVSGVLFLAWTMFDVLFNKVR